MIPKNNHILENARQLRKSMTKQERHLWYDFLRPYPIKFYKQRIIGNYIVDFYCASAKLVIELDGSQHFNKDTLSMDKTRDDFMNQLGLTVLRFTNLEIDNNFDGVCSLIDQKIKCLSLWERWRTKCDGEGRKEPKP